MDITSLIGFIGGIAVILLTIVTSGSISGYIDIPSVICVIGGTVAMTIWAFPQDKLMEGIKALRHVFIYKQTKAEDLIAKVIDLASVARKEGLLALEEAAQRLDDKFMQKGVMLIVDGTDPELVRSILETELSFIDERHKSSQGVYEFMATIGPAFGMIGTLIGLINMLANLSDPTSVGPNMAVALVTTFYGSLLANGFCLPIVNKLKVRSSEEALLREIMMEGMLSIQAGENPRIIEEKLKSFMSPKLRESMTGDQAEKEEGV